jgi:hypothetical protein
MIKNIKASMPIGSFGYSRGYIQSVELEVKERLEQIKPLSDIKKIEWIISSCNYIWFGEQNKQTFNYECIDRISSFIHKGDEVLEDLLFTLKWTEDSCI